MVPSPGKKAFVIGRVFLALSLVLFLFSCATEVEEPVEELVPPPVERVPRSAEILVSREDFTLTKLPLRFRVPIEIAGDWDQGDDLTLLTQWRDIEAAENLELSTTVKLSGEPQYVTGSVETVPGLKNGESYWVDFFLDGPSGILDQRSIQVTLQFPEENIEALFTQNRFSLMGTLLPMEPLDHSSLELQYAVDDREWIFIDQYIDLETAPSTEGEERSLHFRFFDPRGFYWNQTQNYIIEQYMDPPLDFDQYLEGEPLITTDPNFRMETMAGVETLELAYYWPEDGQVPPSDQNQWSLSAPVPPWSAVSIDLDQPYSQGYRNLWLSWRVSAYDGTIGSWNAVRELTMEPLGYEFLPVEGNSEESFTMGSDFFEFDEAPEHLRSQPVPFLLGRDPVSVDQALVLLQRLWRRNALYLEGPVVRLDLGPDNLATGMPILRTGTLDFGENFSLVTVDLDDGPGFPLEAAPGYGNHPLVGVSWFGARILAQVYTEALGLEKAYGTYEGFEALANRSGIRLPTEVEWAFAARSTDGRQSPWGGPGADGNRANYYRSFDPFEDVNEPFTANGGPTNPIGYFEGGAGPFGHRDLLGNVWEWVEDRYWEDAYDLFISGEENPVDTVGVDHNLGDFNPPDVFGQGPEYVIRGNSWNSRAPLLRLSNRGSYSPAVTSYSTGVRFARSIARERN